MKTLSSIHPSKLDWWLAALLIGSPLSVAGTGLYLTITNDAGGLILIGSGICMGGVMAALTIPCRYTLGQSSLIIRCGFLREEIPYEKIKGATLSTNPFNSPALSLCRVKIELEEGFRLISPVHREAFISELESKRKSLVSHPPLSLKTVME